jgi:hypothetical protein
MEIEILIWLEKEDNQATNKRCKELQKAIYF